MTKTIYNKPASDKRGEFRLDDEITIFIETYSSPQSAHESTSMVISKTIDLSANGVQVIMDGPLPMNSILRLCLETVDHQQRFMLTGEVLRQSKVPTSSQYSIGFQLLESDQTDIVEWKKYIAKRLTEEN